MFHSSRFLNVTVCCFSIIHYLSLIYIIFSCVYDMRTGGGNMFCQVNLYIFLISFPSEKTWNENYVIISFSFVHLYHLIIINLFIFLFLKQQQQQNTVVSSAVQPKQQ